MNSLQPLLRFWRVAVIGLIAGVLAFIGSFIVDSTYESTTKLLVRGRDTTFLTSSGETLNQQGTVLDSAIASALGETQSALLSSHVVAETVVDELGLDGPRPAPAGVVDLLRSIAGDLYRNSKAFLVHGLIAEVDDRTRAIVGVHEGLSAAQVEDSYVLELTAQANHPQLAAAIADAAADALVGMSTDRFQTESAAYRDFLAVQVGSAEEEAEAAAEEVRAFKVEHGIADVGTELVLTAESSQSLRQQLRATEIDLEASRAELAAITESLANTTRDDQSVQSIETGRSSTEIVNRAPNTVYQNLTSQREQQAAAVAALEARQQAVEEALASGTVTDRDLTHEEAQLRRLESRYFAANSAFQDLSGRHQEATLSSGDGRTELTRIDTANVPVYPVKPGRYLYLALGLVAGGMLGLLMTVLVGRREGWWEELGGRMGAVNEEADVYLDLTRATSEPPAIPGGPSPDGERRRTAPPDASDSSRTTVVGPFEVFRSGENRQ